jgi:hypothetical protein
LLAQISTDMVVVSQSGHSSDNIFLRLASDIASGCALPIIFGEKA